MLEKIYRKVPQSEVCRGANCWRGKQWRGTSPGSGRSGGEQTPRNLLKKKRKKVENHCEVENLRASVPSDRLSKILKHLKKTNMQNLIILILTSEDNKEPQCYANILEVPFQFEKWYFTELIEHCDSTELRTLCVILKRTYLWVLSSPHIGCAILNYFWGEHGQESNSATLHALHPEQGVAIVLPPEFNIKHSNEEKVDPHEAVCTWTKRDGELSSFEKIISPTWYNFGQIWLECSQPSCTSFIHKQGSRSCGRVCDSQHRTLMQTACRSFSARISDLMKMTRRLPKQVMKAITQTDTRSTMLANRSLKEEMPSVLGLQDRTWGA